MRPRLQLRQLGRVEADRLQARELRRQANVGEELDEAKLVVVGVVGVLGVGWLFQLLSCEGALQSLLKAQHGKAVNSTAVKEKKKKD